LFALQVFDVLNISSELLLNPADFVIPRKERCRVEAFVLAMNKASSDLSFASKGPVAAQDFDFPVLRRETMYRSVTKPTVALVEKLPIIGMSRSAVVVPTDSKHDDEMELKQAQLQQMKIVSKLKAKQLHDQRLEAQAAKEAMDETESSNFKLCYYLRSEFLKVRDAVIHTSVSLEMPSIRDHLIIVCKVFSNLHDLIRPLRARYLGECLFIVILYPYDVTEDMWAPLSMFESIAVVKGSAREEVNLKRAGIYRASKIVAISDGSIQSERGENDLNGNPGSSNFSTKDALVDADSIFLYKCVRRMNPNCQILVDIVHQSSIAYLDVPSAISRRASTTSRGNSKSVSFRKPKRGSNYSIRGTGDFDFKFTPQFASGSLFATCLLDSLICQSFYNKQIVKVIQKFIGSAEQQDEAIDATATVSPKHRKRRPPLHLEKLARNQHSDDENSGGNIPKSLRGFGFSTKGKRPAKAPCDRLQAREKLLESLKDVKCSCFYQMELPDEMNGSSYGALYKHLSFLGIIPLGLLRKPTFAEGDDEFSSNLASFVFTNPSADTILFPLDKVFVLSTTPITADSNRFSSVAPQETNVYASSTHTVDSATSDATHPPHADLASLQRSQQRLQSSVQQLSEEMNHRFDGLMTLLQKDSGESYQNSSNQQHHCGSSAINTATVSLFRHTSPRSSSSSFSSYCKSVDVGDRSSSYRNSLLSATVAATSAVEDYDP